MSLRHFLATIFLWSLSYGQSFGQLIADFEFDDLSNVPESLKKNNAGPPALHINPKAYSDGEGLFIEEVPGAVFSDLPNFDLQIDATEIQNLESVYLEFGFRCQEDFAWFIYSGDLNFRFAHDSRPNRGFNVRYHTSNQTIESGFVGTPMEHGEYGEVAFSYNKESGIAQILKNDEIVWETPEDQRTPGEAFLWETTDGYFTVGRTMNGVAGPAPDGTYTYPTVPTLHYFRTFESPCVNIPEPEAQAASVCMGEKATLHATAEGEGEFLWYDNQQAEVPLDNPEGATDGSIFVTPELSEEQTFWVSYVESGCESTRIPVVASVEDFPELDAGPDTTISRGSSITLRANGNFSTCSWSSNIDFINTPNATSITVSPEHTSRYYVSAENEIGCLAQDTITVYVTDNFPVPNAFSPNNDGRNDTWRIPNIQEYPNCKLLVFNRWGNQVYSSEGYSEPWNGTTSNGEELPAGTYYYTLFLNNEREIIKGSILLLR